VYCGQTAWTIELIFGKHLTHGNNNHVLGGEPNPFRGGASSRQSVGLGSPKLAKNLFED